MTKRTIYPHLFILIFLVLPAISQDISNENHYSTISESYGYADNQDIQEISTIQEYAYNNAKRNILEKTMIHIKSYSKIENFILEYDLIESESEGFLRIIEKKDLGFTGDGRYRVWIKAEVIYHFNGENKISPPSHSENAPLSVKIWMEKEKYILDEKIKIFLLPNKDCYLRLIYNDSENTVMQIFPNQHRKDNYFKAYKLYSIPDDSDPYEFTVSGPFGAEKITLFASTSKLGESLVDNFEPYFYKFDGNEREFSIKTRGVEIINKERPVEFFQESCKIVIGEK